MSGRSGYAIQVAPIRQLETGRATNSELEREDIPVALRGNAYQGEQGEAGMMNEIEIETTIASLRLLYARLETLRHLDMADLLLPAHIPQFD